MDDIWDKIVHELLGSCQSLQQVLEFYDRENLEENSDFLEYLDTQVFECTLCSWWCEISEDVSEDFGMTDLVCEGCMF